MFVGVWVCGVHVCACVCESVCLSQKAWPRPFPPASLLPGLCPQPSPCAVRVAPLGPGQASPPREASCAPSQGLQAPTGVQPWLWTLLMSGWGVAPGSSPPRPVPKAGTRGALGVPAMPPCPQNKENDTLKALLKANVEKPVKLEVFNMKTMRVREVEVVPSNMWGGQGLLGASVRFCSFRGASEHVWHVLVSGQGLSLVWGLLWGAGSLVQGCPASGQHPLISLFLEGPLGALERPALCCPLRWHLWALGWCCGPMLKALQCPRGLMSLSVQAPGGREDSEGTMGWLD